MTREPPAAIRRADASRFANCSKPLEPPAGLGNCRRGVGLGFGLVWANVLAERVPKKVSAPAIAKCRKVKLMFPLVMEFISKSESH